MEYLKAAVLLRSLINETNGVLLEKAASLATSPNRMRVLLETGDVREVEMQTFTDGFVRAALDDLGQSTAFVMTDVASMTIKGREVSYLLYKGYHSQIERGAVFFQVVDKDTFAPMGALQFSNMEENIFYPTDASSEQESSCNAMETGTDVPNGKSIVFLIGHMDEQRLVYDIERLIFDTVNNVMKHPKLQFRFVVHIAHYGGSPSPKLKERVAAIDAFTQKYVHPEYPNATFEFTYEQDASLG